MEIDKKINELPLTKTNPDTLESLFGEKDLQAMWVADSEFQIAPSIQEALIKRISNSGFGYEYKPASFFEAQYVWYKNHYQIDLIKEQTIYSPSIPTTITIAIENLTSKGDGIIIQPPVWIKFRNIIRRTNRKVEKNPLKLVNGRYEIDFENLVEKAKVEQNKMLILCNPHNPVGRVWTKEELEKIVAICKEQDLILISDEIHKDIILFENQFTSLLNYDGTLNKLIICTSEAKTFNLPGILDSMAIIPDDKIRKIIEDTFKKYYLGRTNALTRVALETAYLEGEEWLQQLRKTIEKNVSIIEEELSKSKSQIRLIKPQGTFQVWLDFREVFSDTKEMLRYITKNSKIGLNAGHWFGKEGALFMRMSIATEEQKVKDAIQKIIKAVPNKS